MKGKRFIYNPLKTFIEYSDVLIIVGTTDKEIIYAVEGENGTHTMPREIFENYVENSVLLGV